MTDRQEIIINGVDVSGCDNFRNGYCCPGRLTVVKWVHYYSDNILMHEYILITKCGHKFKFKHNDIAVDNWFVERENRTECLILFILRKVLPICGDSLKQAIREQEWLYG